MAGAIARQRSTGQKLCAGGGAVGSENKLRRFPNTARIVPAPGGGQSGGAITLFLSLDCDFRLRSTPCLLFDELA